MLEIHSNSNKHFEILGRSAEKIHLYLDKQGWVEKPGVRSASPQGKHCIYVCVCACTCVCTCVFPSLAPPIREMFSISFPVSVSPPWV